MAFLRRCLTFLLFLTTLPALTQGARFDLPGPKIDIRVTRAGVTLPIAEVPNLQPADQIWLHPDLPASQSVHYLLIAAFLRGTTNPPPDAWFIRIETWQRRVREEGVIVTVPPEAQQAVLFLAPETSGDFTTLRSAVKGRPGIFVRAVQDLNEAGFEQARIEKYIAEMRRVPPGDAPALAKHSDLLARTLALRPNPDCFKRPLDQQASCLTQTGTQTLLDDGHAQSVAAALTNGQGSDLINQASYTRLAGAGNYSAYVGAIIDLVRLTSSLHTAKYQYIPAIAFPGDISPASPNSAAVPGLNPKPESLSLRLNTAPSFNNPKSVIVIGLPAVQPAVAPPLRPVDPAHISCLLNPAMVLPVEGAPLVFSTNYAHDLILHLNSPNRVPQVLTASSAPLGSIPTQNIPLLPDAYQGGVILDPHPQIRKELPLIPEPAKGAPGSTVTPSTLGSSAISSAPAPATPGTPTTATVQGFWGFDTYTGPTVALQQTSGTNWRVVDSPQTALIAGKPNHLQILATGTACIQSIALEPENTKADWKLATQTPPPQTPQVEPVDLTLNLKQSATPGTVQLAIQQFGTPTPDRVGTRTFAQPAHLDSLRIHAGDPTGELTGTSLDQVKSVTLKDLTLTPEPCSSGAPGSTASSSTLGTQDPPCDPSTALTLSLPSPLNTKPTFHPNEKLTATILLQDGRTLDLLTAILPPRPVVAILSSRVTQPTPSPIQLTNPADLPLGGLLTFFLKSVTPFPRAEQIEISNADGSLHTTLSVTAGTLILEDAHTVLATFDPLKLFGPSTFGPFRLRALAPDGTSGQWLTLTTIVRLPTLTSLHCPTDPAAPCTLSGTSLYLIECLSPDPTFATSSQVPQDFVNPTLPVPHATLYLRLRDDPNPINQLLLPIQTDPPPQISPNPRARSSSDPRNNHPALAPP